VPVRSTIDLLPAELREWLNDELQRRNFSGYRELVDAFNAKLEEHGLELQVNRSSLQRYGQGFEEQVANMRQTAEMARSIVRDAPDEDGAMNDALIRLVMDRLFRFAAESGDIKPGVLAKIGHVVADLGRSSVAQKKLMAQLKGKATATAEKVAAAAKSGGLSAEAVEAIRRDILGIVGE
jgi:hypothetical protein